jgi:uncharacterized protein (DUF427 family)
MNPHYPPPLTMPGHVAPVARRIRGVLGTQTVLDTTAALYLWEWPYYPQYQIPRADIDSIALTVRDDARGLPHGTAQTVDLSLGAVSRPDAGHLYVSGDNPALVDTVRLQWGALDAWYEEDEQVFVHPRNPYHRVDALRSRRLVHIERNGVTLAESDATVMVFETGLPTRYYLDRSAVDFARLQSSATVTACPYKGQTTGYWSVPIDGPVDLDLAWSYDFPTLQLQAIAGLVAFYNERVDVTIDGARLPRPSTIF